MPRRHQVSRIVKDTIRRKSSFGNSDKVQQKTAQLKKQAEEAVLTWVRANDPHQIKVKVHRELDRMQTDIMWAVLGVERDFGRVRVRSDRNGASAIHEYMTTISRGMISEWLDENGALPKMTEDIKKAIRVEFEDELFSALRSRVRDLAQQKADDLIKGVVEQLVASVEHSLHLDVSLLDPQTGAEVPGNGE